MFIHITIDAYEERQPNFSKFDIWVVNSSMRSVSFGLLKKQAGPMENYSGQLNFIETGFEAVNASTAMTTMFNSSQIWPSGKSQSSQIMQSMSIWSNGWYVWEESNQSVQ